MNEEFTKHFELALLSLPPDDRLGTLFGALCGLLCQQGFDTEDKLRAELEKGLQFVVKTGVLDESPYSKVLQ